MAALIISDGYVISYDYIKGGEDDGKISHIGREILLDQYISYRDRYWEGASSKYDLQTRDGKMYAYKYFFELVNECEIGICLHVQQFDNPDLVCVSPIVYNLKDFENDNESWDFECKKLIIKKQALLKAKVIWDGVTNINDKQILLGVGMNINKNPVVFIHLGDKYGNTNESHNPIRFPPQE